MIKILPSLRLALVWFVMGAGTTGALLAQNALCVVRDDKTYVVQKVSQGMVYIQEGDKLISIRPGKWRIPTHQRTNSPVARKENRYSPPGHAFTLTCGAVQSFTLGAAPTVAPQAAGSASSKAPRSLTRQLVSHFGRTP